MLYLNFAEHLILRKELRTFLSEIENVSLYEYRRRIKEMLWNGEHRLETVVTFIDSLVMEALGNITIEHLASKENHSKISLMKFEPALRTYLISYAMNYSKRIA